MSNALQSLCIAPLTAPGKIGATKVLSQPTQSWEKNGNPVMEGPAALYHGGKTYLTYSASFCWTPNYSLGLLTWNGSGDPALENSWAKSGPYLTSANGNYGPGHNGSEDTSLSDKNFMADRRLDSSLVLMAPRSGTCTTRRQPAQVHVTATDTQWHRRSIGTRTAHRVSVPRQSWAL